MNQVAKIEPKTDELANMAMITIAPEKYVAALYEPFKKKLETAKVEADKIVFAGTGAEGEVVIDITTTAGMEVAKKQRAFFRDEIRLAADKEREARKAPILKISNLLQDGYKEILADVAPYESKFDVAIKSEEARKERERLAKIEAERKRVAEIRADIDTIKRYPVDAVGRNSSTLAQMLDSLREIQIGENFAEFADEARAALAGSIAALETMHTAAAKHEADLRQIEIDRENLRKQRDAQEAETRAAKEKAEQEAAAERERQAEANRIERDRLAAVAAQQEADRKKLADDLAELARQKAELEAAKNPPPVVESAPAIVPAEPTPPVTSPELTAARAGAIGTVPAFPAKPQRPSDQELIGAIASHFDVDSLTALAWLTTLDFEEAAREVEVAA